MIEIDKKNLKNYLYFTFGITYIAWGLLAIFTQSYILGLETFMGRILHIVGALGPAIASGFYLKSKNIKFKHFVLNKRENSSMYQIEEKINFDNFLQSFSFTRESKKTLKKALHQHS